jgi:hypothetical protein
MKLDSMADNLKISLGNTETIQCFIGDILNPPAFKTDQVMMQGHIGIKPRPFMSDVDLSHKSGFSKHPKGVIDSIAGNHRMPSLHDLI